MPLVLPQERIGTVLADKYRLDRILGRGGMGVVMAGVHTWTDRPVAVKLLAPELTEDGEVVSRFLREARTAAKLKHPNVVDVLDMGTSSDGAVFMVLELLEGESLFELLEREKQLAPARALSLLLPVIDALAFAHDQEIVHRDVKPENVFLSVDARGRVVPKLLDFGIAKVRDADRTRATQTGTVIGTPYYMSPEQARGAKDLGPASDVWAAGVVLYECLSGALPFEAETATAVLAAILTTDPRPLAQRIPDAPPTLVRVIDRALARDVDDRFGSARVFLQALVDAAQKDAIALEGLDEVIAGMLALAPTGAREVPPDESDLAVRSTMQVQGDTPPAARLARSMESKRREAEGGASSEPPPPAVMSEPPPPPAASRAPWLIAGLAVVATIGIAIWGFTQGPELEADAETEPPSAATEPPAPVSAPEPPAVPAPVATPPAPTPPVPAPPEPGPAAPAPPEVGRRRAPEPPPRPGEPAVAPAPLPVEVDLPLPERGANDSLIID
jgi:serine/threonine-protein kinase